MKLKNKKLVAMLMLFSFVSYVPLATTMATAANLPDLNQAYGGSVNTVGNQMNVTVNGGAGAVGQFDWNSFNVANGYKVNFAFSNHSQTSLNRVLAQGGLSQIYGSLTNSCAGDANCASYVGTSKVILINPAGIMFGNGSTVDLNSFTATTFDIKGAKNLASMTEAEKATYYTNVLAPLKSVAYFEGNQNATSVKLDGSTFNIDKSLAIASNNVDIKDSVIKTNIAFNYGGTAQGVGHNQSFSNVRIVTADGVNFAYQANGNINAQQIKNDSTAGTSTNRDITISGATIQSGSVHIENKGSKTGNDVEIKNSLIRGVKLVNAENGDVYIKSANDIDIDGTELVTNNTTRDTLKTENQTGGRIFISAGKNATVTNSKIQSAHALQSFSTTTGQDAADVTIYANNGSATVDNTNIMSKGNLNIMGTDKVTVKDSAIQAKNTNAGISKYINIAANNSVDVENSYVESSGKTQLYSPNTVNVASANVYTGDNLILNATNTTVTDSNLNYHGLDLTRNGLVNNVTIKGTTTLQDLSSPDHLVISTNGNLTIDDNDLKKGGFQSTVDNSTLEVTVTPYTPVNQNKITLESTGGKVTVKNGSNVQATDDITLNALDTTNGATIINNSTLGTNGDVNINQYLVHTAGTNLTANSTINADNINITTTGANSDIIADQANFANLNYNRLALNAGRDNIITGSKAGGMNITNVDFNATGDNTINYNTATPGSATLAITGSTLKGNNNTIATNGSLTVNNTTIKGTSNDVAALKDITLTDVTVQSNTTAPENTKTNVRAGEDLVATNFDINQTKLIADSNKVMNLELVNANNENAGVEVNASARNNGTQGSTVNKTGDVELYALTETDVTVNAKDNELAFSKIKGGSVNLDANDRFIAAITDLTTEEIDGITEDTTGRAYIEVANWGEFNLDPIDPEGTYLEPDSFTYTDHFVEDTYQPAVGEAITTYKKHFIEFNNDTTEKFILVYDKPVDCTEPPSIDSTPSDPFVDEDVFDSGISDTLSSLIEQTRLPRQLEPTSNVATVNNNTTDPTSGIVNAAARIEVVTEQNATTTNEDEDEFEI